MNDNRPRMVEVPAELLALCLIALRQCGTLLGLIADQMPPGQGQADLTEQCDALLAVSKRIREFECG
ncbi:hypothetical protein [Elstera cyanobacteriorum]|uniref:hypothetical protein n=1 Tax=Elstera cyanobacteriorum TaxID=2022747 RepID=UPI0023576A81|nr:hypothetical protein [Elstera cyanobacteriorum]MCK6442322.1 hypothetical protein [Elstera cyanobacteriorum]